MTRNKIWVPVALLAAALVVWAFVGRGEGAGAAYRYVAVARGDVESVVTATGTLQATETVDVGTQVSGQIAELYADFNDRVRKGQLLARIDPTILQQEVRAAEANVLRNGAELEQSRRQLERNRELHSLKVITANEFEQSEYGYTVAQAAYTSAQVSLERARRNLGYTEIRAPIDGVVVERSVDVGQTVAASTSAPTLFLIAQDLSQMEILASVDESDIGRIREGMEARFTVQAYGDESFGGVVEQVRLQSAVQENVVSYAVVVKVANPERRLLPGMTATVEFIVARAADVLRVPNAALRFQPTEEMRAAAAARREGAAGTGAANSRPAGAGSRGAAANRGVLWVVGEDGAPAVVRVQTGLTDGQYTEVSGDAVAEGAQAIAGVASGPAAQAAPNPFQGVSQGQRGGPPRGF